ncbi:MAG: MATE family efflux transporter [bacterium]|nr:MATE family efflux transporter [bacterium]
MNTQTKDLTQGSVSKQLILYALPLIATSLLQSLYSIADLLIAGRTVGSVGLSAINNSSQIMTLVTKIAIGLSTGGSILIGQCFGGKDEEGQKEAVRTLFTICIFAGVVSTFLLWCFSRPLLLLLDAPALEEANTYLQICALGMVFIWGYNALSATLRATGDSANPFRIIMVSSAINVVLDLIFMGPLQMGVAGAALATMLSQGISFLIALQLVLKQKGIYGLKIRVVAEKLRLILKLGIPCVLQMTIAAISWLVVTYFINGYGVDVSAGNGVSVKIKDICQLVISSMSTGVSAMIAQNLGAQLYDRAKQVLYTTMKLALLISVGMILFVEFAAPALAGCFSDEAAVIDAAVLNLRIEMIGQIFYACFLSYHALMTGAGHTTMVMISSFTNCILVRVVLAALFNRLWGLPGVYLACMIAPFSSVPIGMIYTRSGIWKRSLLAKTGTATSKKS